MGQLMNFVDVVNGYGRTVPIGAPPVIVAHPNYGALGHVVAGKGFVPERGRWASTRAILRDCDRKTVKALRKFEDYAPKFALAGMLAMLARDPHTLPLALGAISTYDGIVAARGSGAMQDVWMNMTATQTPATTVWYDLMNFASWQPMTAPSITAYVNAATGGAVLDAASNGGWLSNPAGTNKKYIVSMGLTITNIAGFALAMLYDCLWAGSYNLVSNNVTINPTTDVSVTRYGSSTPGNAEYAGGNMMQMVVYSATFTFSVPGTITTTYTNQGGTTGKTTIFIPSASTLAIWRIIANTGHNSATVLPGTPFMPLTNGGDSGVIKLEQVVIAGMTCTVGTVYHKIVRPLILMPFIAASSYIEQDSTLNIGNMVELHNASQVCGCLGWNLFSAGTSAGAMSAFMRTVEG